MQAGGVVGRSLGRLHGPLDRRSRPSNAARAAVAHERRHDSSMQHSHWRAYFEGRSERPRPALDDLPEIPPRLRAHLAGSLARFQLGETGEGRIVGDLRRRADAWGLHADYLEALRLFIAEEGRHAAILGTAVRALGGHTLQRTWSADVFARVRRVAGPGLELLVLLAAEVAALCFYGTLVERLPSGPLRTALAEIAGDEAMHLRFHVGFLRSTLPSPIARRAVATLWAGLGMAAGAVVVADHGATLRQLGTTRRAVLERAMELVGDTVAELGQDGTVHGKRGAAWAAWCGASHDQPAATIASMARRVCTRSIWRRYGASYGTFSSGLHC